jgi:hypothetical protein
MFRRLSDQGIPCRLWLGTAIMLWASPLAADHALTQEGRGLFNVYVEQTATTWSRLLRVRYKPESFEYDYDRNQIIQALGSGSGVYWIADVLSTSTTTGKTNARRLMRSLGWHRYDPPPPAVVIPPPPTPRPTATPAPTEAPDPNEIADSLLPLEKRMEAQRQIFADQKAALLMQIRFAFDMRQMDDTRARELRLKLLERQQNILARYYPPGEEIVRTTKEELDRQADLVKKTGRFSWED